MELSINFLVITILSLITFTAGLFIIYEIMHTLDDVAVSTIQRMNEEIDHRLTQEGLAISTRYISEGDLITFLYGIRNTFNTSDFYLWTECDLVTHDNTIACDDDEGISCDAYDSWAVLNPVGPITVASNDIWKGNIFFNIPKGADKGVYTFDVIACKDYDCSKAYGVRKQLNIVVNN